MRGILLLVFLLLDPTAAMAQANPLDCKGAGCCCNRQAGGDWPDCAQGYECRGQTGPPYAQVCVKRGASPLTIPSLRPGQPAKCALPEGARQETEPEVAGTGCIGAGCCCNQQAGGAWPDCARGYECRRQTGPPFIQVCVLRGARANAPLQLRPGEPARCTLPAVRGTPKKRRQKQEAHVAPSRGHPACARMTHARNRQLCNEMNRAQRSFCNRRHKGAQLRKCLQNTDDLVKSFYNQDRSCDGDPNCNNQFGIVLENMVRSIKAKNR